MPDYPLRICQHLQMLSLHKIGGFLCFDFKEGTFKFLVAESEKQPMFNPLFIINNWTADKINISLTLNGNILTDEKNYRRGIGVEIIIC